MNESSQSIYSVSSSSIAASLNPALKTGFYKHHQSPDIKRSHLFNGRYENIYIGENKIPELKIMLQEAMLLASPLIKTTDVKAGLWFNHMPPGSVTNPHNHDNYDELLSAVYYICVPQHSGNLLVHDESKIIEIRPEEGMFVFFKPDVVHEVSENKSQENRLSIGINFGLKDSKQGIQTN